MTTSTRYPIIPRFSASVDWQSLIRGIGYVSLFPCGTNDSVGKKYILISEKTIEPDKANLKHQANDDFSLDWDVKVNVPLIIEAADAFIVYTFITNDVDVTNTWTFTRIRSAVETTIATVISQTLAASRTGRYNHKMTCTRTLLAPNDTLRLSLSANSDGQAGGNHTLHFDPTSDIPELTESDGTLRTIGTDIIFSIPVKMDA